jgi:hypothetical protein
MVFTSPTAPRLLYQISKVDLVMRSVVSHWLLAAFLLSLPGFIGCAGEEPAPTPQKMEELRQQQKERSEAFNSGK